MYLWKRNIYRWSRRVIICGGSEGATTEWNGPKYGGGGGFQRGSTACIERGFLDVKGQGPCSGVDVPT